jgi:UDP-GlcNAc:undecaprenyl-phosphate/decaprenyl-phosphate GlcNAc-1-phosphate transferase
MTNTGAIAAGSGFMLVVPLVPIVRKLCVRWRLYDWPGPLKPHKQPIPRLGGIAIAIAIVGGVFLSIPSAATSEVLLVAAVALICIVGTIDDIRGLSAALRLMVQIIAGAMLWFGCGRLTVLDSSIFGLVASCVLTVAIVNSLNFLDGADGLASGVAGIVGVIYALVPWPEGDRLAPTVAWALAAGCAGFLFSNFPPAKIFLGDSGSTVLGLSIAFLSLSFYHSPVATGPRLLLPLVVAGLPLVDLALAVIRRARGRVSPFFGDRRHFYDLLSAHGASARKVALVCYAATALLGLIGLIGVRAKAGDFFFLASVGVVTLLIAAVRMGALQLDRERNTTAKGSDGSKSLKELARSRS